MKAKIKYLGFGIVLILTSVILLTPVGPKLRNYAGRILSYGAVKLKADKAVPEDAYDWEVTDLDGEVHSFQDKKGEVVFLNLWATWCKPCLEEIPDLQMLFNDYGNKVNFMLVSQEEFGRVINFVQKRGYNLPFYYSKNQVPEIFRSSTIPTTYILNKDGKIVMAENGAVDWNGDEIRELLDKLITE
ncbi:TlpA family protein disulfide reductase [Zobellia roscoffensis]|uniref:TlpA family protein disulfide reductase n=1 Tax=Zobellia roscoffensis TaxID=2779508 RepID=UPI00188C4FB0|nr:TlpA disulfide reductase family protein [Zobellia roscoffensis]